MLFVGRRSRVTLQLLGCRSFCVGDLLCLLRCAAYALSNSRARAACWGGKVEDVIVDNIVATVGCRRRRRTLVRWSAPPLFEGPQGHCLRRWKSGAELMRQSFPAWAMFFCVGGRCCLLLVMGEAQGGTTSSSSSSSTRRVVAQRTQPMSAASQQYCRCCEIGAMAWVLALALPCLGLRSKCYRRMHWPVRDASLL